MCENKEMVRDFAKHFPLVLVTFLLVDLEIGAQMSSLQADLSADSKGPDSGSTTAGSPCLTSRNRHTLSAVG